MVRTPKGLVENAVLKAIETYAKHHAGEWFRAASVFSGYNAVDISNRKMVSSLYAHGYLEERQITCLMADGGLWMSVNPACELVEHLQAVRAAR